MKTPDPLRTSLLTVSSFAVLVLLVVKCSSGVPDNRSTAAVDANGVAVQATGTPTNYSSADTIRAQEHTATMSAEQKDALARHHLLDLRIRLEHELAVVRLALNDGTLPAARQARYKEQAADLGNNIAQLDAARNEMEMATPENMVAAREHANSEVAEVERWLDSYEKNDETASVNTSTYSR